MYSLETVLGNYRLLSHDDLYLRDQANQFLIRAIECTQIWSIAQEIIITSQSADQKLLGAQLLYQKIERNIDHLILEELQSLREFIFIQLTDATLSLPIVKKLASGAALLASSLFLDHWPLLIRDIVKFMEASPLQFRNGLAFLERLPEQLRNTNRIKHGIKLKIRQNLLDQSDLIGSIFISALSFEEDVMTLLSLDALQHWVNMGLPLLKLGKVLKKVIELSQFQLPSQTDSFLDECFKVICEGLHYCSQQKFQTLDQIEFSLQRERYGPQEFSSLAMIINYMRDTKPIFLKILNEAVQINRIESYLTIIKQILLSYSFLLMEDLGYELIELMNKTLNCSNLKISYSTFEFWLQLGQKMMKCKINSELNSFFWHIVDNLLDIILHKTILQNQSMMFQTSPNQDTIDDINSINFQQYRKQAQNIIKFSYSYFTHKKKQEGSANFFKKLSDYIEVDSEQRRGIELAIYAIKSVIEQIKHDYDQDNVVNFIVYLMNQMSRANRIPPRLILEAIGLIKQGCAFMKNNHQLQIKCMEFCLGYIEDELYCDCAFESFELLMKTVNICENQTIIDDLLKFYESKNLEQPLILNKILQTILDSIVKLTNKDIITNYLNRIFNRIKSINDLGTLNNHVLLDEIRTLLDSYQAFPLQHKQFYLSIFMKMSINAIQIIYKIIFDCLNKKLQWTSTQLGLSVMTIKSTLRLCDNVIVQCIPISGYLSLMNLVVMIFKSNDVSFFLEYVGLLDIFHQILSKFRDVHILILDQWLRQYLPSINNFFLKYTREYQEYFNGIDPDVVKHCLSIQQSLILYDKSIYLQQPQHEDIFNLTLMSMQHLNQKNLHRRILSFLNHCVTLKEIYGCKYTFILQAIFISLPNFNSSCYSDLSKIIICLFENVDLHAKQTICCQMLQNEPYLKVEHKIKDVAAKFIAFAFETKIQKYIKRAMAELAEMVNNKANIDHPLHLQLQLESCKKEFAHLQKRRLALK